MRVVYLALAILLSVVGAAHAQAVSQAQPAIPGHVACWAANGAIFDCGNGTGNYIITWPPVGDVVLSNGTTNPSGVAPSTNGCLTASGGVWGIGTCGSSAGGGVTSVTAGSGLSGGTITSAGTISLAPINANSLLGALANTAPSSLAVPNCSGGSNALTWSFGVGFGCNTINAGGTVTSVATGSGLTGGTISTSGTISLASQAANTLMASLTASAPTGIVIPPCNSAGQALNWTAGGGFGCAQITGSGGSGTISSITAGTGLSGGTITTSGTIALGAISANQLLGALTATAPGGLSVPSCSSGANALTWTLGVGFGCNTIAAGGTVTSVASGTGLTGGPITGSGTISLAAQTANTVMASLNGAAPSGVAVPGCSGTNQALTWTAGGGFGCITISGGGGSGGVSSLSVNTANGFAGSVANATTTPAITISTTTNGLLKGVGGTLTPAVAGTDYLTPTGVGSGLTGITYTQLPALSANQILASLTTTTPAGITVPSCSGTSNALIWTNGVGFGCATISNGGTVTSITPGAGLSGSSSPITSSGTISLANQSANTIMAALSAGVPTGLVVPPCSGSSNALNWTSGVGFGCATVSGGGAGTPAVQDFLAGTNFTPGATSGLTLASAPSASAVVSVYFDGVHQSADTWTLSSTSLVFSAVIPVNVQVVEVQWVLSSGSGGGGGISSITFTNGLTNTTITSSGTVGLAAVSPNTVLGAVSSGSPTPLAMPSCNTSTSALTWQSNVGFGCNTNAGGGGSSGITINQSTVTNGVSGYLLYNNGGVVGNATVASFFTSPPAIGTTAPAPGSFTALSATSISGGGFSNFLATSGTGQLIQPTGGGWWWDSGQVVYNATESTEPWEYVSGTIATVTTSTGGTTPTFTVGFYINGAPITGCTGIVVTSSTPVTTNCTAANTITQGQYLTAVISSAGGTPQNSLVAYAGSRSNF